MNQTMAFTLAEVVRQLRQIQYNARTQGDTARPR
jgi:phosphoketolase